MATYPIKMLRDEDRKEFVPFTNAAAVVDSDNKSLQELMDNGKYKIQNNVTTSSANKGVLDAYQGKVLNDKFNNYIPLSQKGVANGVASLDAEGKVPSTQLPSYVDDVIESYIVSGSTALSAGWLSKTNGGTALTPEKGKIYLIMTSGAYQNKQYRWGGSTYVLCNPSDVNSVNGMTGVVTLKTLTLKTAAGTPNTINETFNAGTDKTITINVPTKTSHITNDSGFITSSASITGNAATATKATQDSAGNIIVDTYVKKTGGTMTGGLVVPTLSVSESHRFTTQGEGDSSDLVLTVNDTSYMVFEYNTDEKSMRPSNTTKGLVDLGSSTNKWNNVYANSFNGNVSGNASSATKLQTARTINTVGFDGTANIEIPYLAAPDNRNVLVPSSLKSAYISVGFGSFGGFDSATNDSKYVDYIGLNTWKNSSGGLVNALVFSKSAAALYHYSGSFDADTWTTKKQIAYTDSDITGNAATATTADKTKAALTIQKNGTTVGSSFNGSTARTINITVPTKVTDLSDNTNYVQKTDYASASTAGVVKLGTGLTAKDGVISVTGSATADSVEWAAVKNAPTTVSYWTNDSGYITRSSTMTGASASAAGTAGTVPAPAAGKQAQFLRGDGTWTEPSYAASAGSATKAIQDGNGKVIASTYLPLAGGIMQGPIKWTSSTALPQATNLEYIVGIDAFADGGTMKWIGIDNLKASKDGSGNVITSTYVKKAGDTMTGDLTVNTGTINYTTAASIKYNTTDKCLEFIFK